MGRSLRINLKSYLRFRFLQQDYVGVGVAVQYAKIFPVGRPVEEENLFGAELCDGVSGRAVEGLQPDVIDSVFANGVGERLAVRGELRARGNVGIDVDDARRGKRCNVEKSHSCGARS